jgi:hypothetical protein
MKEYKNRTIILIVIFMTICNSYAQINYKVIYSDGNVFIKDSLIVKGYLLKETDSLTFKNGKGILKVCFSNCKKIKVLTGNIFSKINSQTISDYTTYYENLGVRGDSDKELLKLDNLYANTKVAILDTLKIAFNESQFVVNDSKFFFLRFLSGKRTYNIKLFTKNNTILIPKEAFSDIEGNLPTHENNLTSIYYYDLLEQKSTLIAFDFRIVFISTKLLKKNLFKILNGTYLTIEEKKELVSHYFLVYYPDTFFSVNDIVKLL